MHSIGWMALEINLIVGQQMDVFIDAADVRTAMKR